MEYLWCSIVRNVYYFEHPMGVSHLYCINIKSLIFRTGLKVFNIQQMTLGLDY